MKTQIVKVKPGMSLREILTQLGPTSDIYEYKVFMSSRYTSNLEEVRDIKVSKRSKHIVMKGVV